MNKNWRLIRVINEKILNIPPHISDYLAVETVLRSCATGMSVKSISRAEGSSVKEVEEIIEEFYETSGWDKDLDLNTLLVFKRVKGSYKKFLKEIRNISPLISKEFIIKAFYICSLYVKIKKEIKKHYDYKFELPDFNNMTEIVEKIRGLSLKKITLENNLKSQEATIVKASTVDSKYFVNNKPPSMTFLKSTYLFTGIDGELLPLRAELAEVLSDLEHARLTFDVLEDMIEVWRTQSANERRSVS